MIPIGVIGQEEPQACSCGVDFLTQNHYSLNCAMNVSTFPGTMQPHNVSSFMISYTGHCLRCWLSRRMGSRETAHVQVVHFGLPRVTDVIDLTWVFPF